MKVNLLNDGAVTRSNAINIDPFADPTDESRVFGGYKNLDLHVDDGEAEEIIAYDIVDYLQAREIEGTIDGWIKKLKFNGKITIGGVDIHELAKGILNGTVDTKYINDSLYEDFRHKHRASVSSIQNIVNLLQNKGLKILHKRVNNFRYVVVAERV